MAFPTNQVYVRYDFTVEGTDEIQVTGLWGTVEQEGIAEFPNWGPLTQAIAEQARDAWLTMPTARFVSSVIAMRAVAYHYRQDHKEVLDRAEASFEGADAWRGSGNSYMPLENTVVLSLWGYNPSTYVPQRARKRGRMYLPTLTSTGIEPDGTLSQSQQDIWVAAGQGLMNTLSAQLDIPGEPLLDDTHFRPQAVSVTGQISTKVTHVRVGQVIDTQRRRRNQQPEQYRTLPINQ